MSTIDHGEFTDDQTERTERLLREWEDVALSTGPVPHLAGERRIRLLYRDAGRRPPTQFAWCRSPVSMLLADRLLGGPIPIAKPNQPRLDDLIAQWVATLPSRIAEQVQQDIDEVMSVDPGACLQDELVRELIFDVDFALRSADRNRFEAVQWQVERSPLHRVVEASRHAIITSLDRWRSGAAPANGSDARRLTADATRNFAHPYLPRRVADPVAFGGGLALLAARLDVFAEVLGKSKETEPVHHLIEVARYCHGFIAYENLCLVLERPSTVHRDEFGRLHHPTGPAVAYPDGWGVYAVHGTVVPGYVIATPARVGIGDIDCEADEAVREVMLSAHGLQRYVAAVEMETLATDKFGTLLRRQFPGGGEPLVMVKVINATPEPDGQRKQYLLRVPPYMESPREAVAWTFGLEAEAYAPVEET